MGIRIEIVLVTLIVLIVMFSINVKIDSRTHHVNTVTKELEFNNTTFIEVGTDKMYTNAFAQYGIRESGILKLYQFNYHTEGITLLKADKATYKDDMIYLDENIHVKQESGFEYKATHAVYDTKSEELEITSDFTATMNKNTIHGKSIILNIKKKEASAKQIDAVVYTTENNH